VSKAGDVPEPRSRDGGFVLALVVLMLFAITIIGGAGYLVVNAEGRMARYAGQGEEALAVARGGLHRFVAEQLGGVADSSVYAMGGGEARVRARRVAALGPATDLYFVRAEGVVTDPILPGAPARRTVGAYAYHRKRPVPLRAAVVVNAQQFRVATSTYVTGVDTGATECPGGAAPPIGGAIARSSVVAPATGSLSGSPASATWAGGYAQLMAEMGVRWDVLSAPSFPVDFENLIPDFSTLPANAFPVIRWNGNFMGVPPRSGRGVLIVTGEFDSTPMFHWSGIVLAGWVDQRIMGSIDGMLVGGFANVDPHTQVETTGPIGYHSCNVARANEALSHLELVDDVVFEID